jgi:hypothetical protein
MCKRKNLARALKKLHLQLKTPAVKKPPCTRASLATSLNPDPVNRPTIKTLLTLIKKNRSTRHTKDA